MKNRSVRIIISTLLIASMISLFVMNSSAVIVVYNNSFSKENALYNNGSMVHVQLGGYSLYITRTGASSMHCYAKTTSPSYNNTSAIKVWNGTTTFIDTTIPKYYGEDSIVDDYLLSMSTYDTTDQAHTQYYFQITCEIEYPSMGYYGSVEYNGYIRKINNYTIYIYET